MAAGLALRHNIWYYKSRKAGEMDSVTRWHIYDAYGLCDPYGRGVLPRFFV